MNKEISYALEFPLLDDMNPYPSIEKYRKFSIDTLKEINKELNKEFDSLEFSIVVAGSFGRLEASESSDFDYFFLYYSKPTNFEDIHEKFKSIIRNKKIVLPNPTGVFAEQLTIEQIISNIGGSEDKLQPLARRMLLLMESRAIYNQPMYEKIIDEFLLKYLEYTQNDPYKEAIVLLNDTIRYFRSICVNYQHSFWKENDKWVIRNVKLRNSRVVMYAGLLLLILNASKHLTSKDNKINYIKSKIFKSPLEKIVDVYLDNQDYGFKKVLGLYDFFLRKINDPDIRKGLEVDYKDRHTNEYYLELKVTSENLQTELTRFIFSKKYKWSNLIYEYLIF